MTEEEYELIFQHQVEQAYLTLEAELVLEFQKQNIEMTKRNMLAVVDLVRKSLVNGGNISMANAVKKLHADGHFATTPKEGDK